RTATRCTAIQNAIEQINIPRTWSRLGDQGFGLTKLS
ncbi:MAG: hypothetical protein QOJ74_1290, partial [Ilumatobacteraceae bacterium]|nr:hypothetical protein [Ilumatobacteraceae bacterium]